MRMLALALPLLLVGLAGCTEPDDTGDTGDAATGRDSCNDVTRASLTLANASSPVVAMATSQGCIVAELNQEKVPITVANFLAYTDEGFYSDLLIHRIVKDFMIQTGGMAKDGEFKDPTHPMIQNEAKTSGLKNEMYTLSMARLGPRCGTCPDQPDSATNQFFINLKANTNLDATATAAGYAVFGTVVQGRDVVDAIASVPVRHHNPADGTKCQGPETSPSCPIDDVDLFSIKRVA